LVHFTKHQTPNTKHQTPNTMLGFLTVLMMLIVVYTFWGEGVVTAFTMAVNVFLAGLVAFNYWEPLADYLEPMFRETFLEGYEDFLVLVVLFSVVLGVLRLACNSIVHTQIDQYPMLQQLGAVFFGLLTGYLLAGFEICVLQTLPWHENFMSFEPKVESENKSPPGRHFLPPDRVWLALMNRAGRVAFSQTPEDVPGTDTQVYPTFDPNGNFEIRYARHRRYTDTRDLPLPYQGVPKVSNTAP
jgi:uncharacterized membrane protein required for colicin V production